MQQSTSRFRLAALFAAALVATLAAALAIGCSSAKIADSRVIEDLNSTGALDTKIAGYDYTDSTTMKVDSLNISNQSTSSSDSSATKVTFDGVAKNDSYAMEFSGTATYKTANGNTTLSTTPSITANKIYPTKGVDWIQKTSSDSNANLESVKSSLAESSGSYTCEATQVMTYDFWFAKDTADITAKFAFTQDKGWQMQGDPTVTDERTEWLLAGKTLEGTGTFEGTNITFKEITKTTQGGEGESGTSSSASSSGASGSSDASDASDGTNASNLQASYDLKYTSPYTSNSIVTYHDINQSGNFGVTLTHEFGKDSFNVAFVDSAESITIKLRTASDKTVAGVGVKKCLIGEISSNIVYVSTKNMSDTTLEKSIEFTLKS